MSEQLSKTISDDELVSYAAGSIELPRALEIYELSRKDADLAAGIKVISFIGGGPVGEQMALNHLSGGLLERTTNAADSLANWVYANATTLSQEQREKLVKILEGVEEFEQEYPLDPEATEQD